MNIRGVMDTARIFVVRHGPEILTAIGTAGLIVAGIMAVNETPRAMDILKEHEENVDTEEPLTVKEKIKDCWKVYLPSVILAGASVASIVCARRIDARRLAAWAAAYQMSENALLQLEDSIKNEFNENKVKKLKDDAAIKQMEEHPYSQDDVINTGDGNDLFYNAYTNQPIRTSMNALTNALARAKNTLLDDDFMSLNDWNEMVGDKRVDPDIGELVGMNSTMYKKDGLSLFFTWGHSPWGEPCGYFKLDQRFVADYYNLHG